MVRIMTIYGIIMVGTILYLDLLKAHYNCVEWKAVDISTVYNITDLEPDITKQVCYYD